MFEDFWKYVSSRKRNCKGYTGTAVYDSGFYSGKIDGIKEMVNFKSEKLRTRQIFY